MLSEQTLRKFEDVIDVSDYEIETPQGWVSINSIMKTIQYEVWKLEIDYGSILQCADNHIVFRDDYTQVYVKDLKINDYILTKDGKSKVTNVENLGYSENMYDFEIDSEEHEFYTNDIVSHNTTTSAAYLVYELCFSKDITIAILANKASTSVEILDRVKNMLEDLPWFLKPGVKEWNKTSIELEDRRKVVAAATSASSIRGLSISMLLLDEFAHIQNDVEFYTSTYPVISSGDSTKVIIISTPNGMNLFHKIYTEAVDGRNAFVPKKFIWNHHPERGIKWEKETRANTANFAQEFESIAFNSIISINNEEMQIGDLFNLLKNHQDVLD